MKFSIIIPVYNAEKYIDSCLSSIIKQSYKNYEIIVIDDGSTDRTLDICQRYKKNNTDINIIVYHQENTGVSAARNRGIKLATGKYIIFVDADDEINEKMLCIYDKYVDLYDADLIFCGYEEYNLDFEKSKLYSVDNNWIGTKEEFLMSKFDELFYKWMVHSPWNKVFKSKIIKQNMIKFNEEYSIYEDVNFVLDNLNNVNSIVVLSDILYTYKVKQQGSLVTKYHPNAYSAYFDFNDKLEILLGNKKDTFNLFIFNKFITFIDQMYFCERSNNLEKKKLMQNIYLNCKRKNITKVGITKNIRINLEIFLIIFNLYSILNFEHSILIKLKGKVD